MEVFIITIQLGKIAEFYKALGDEIRLRIIDMLSEQEMCVCEIIERLGLSQPAVSHHLKILKHAGILRDTKEGKWIYYSLNTDVFSIVFPGEEETFLASYAQSLKSKLKQTMPSRIRKDPALCERLTNKK
ncbi:metalloregulator ArsR/SmtB family transcription factor [Desulfosporosinus sp. FKB]|uniref:ArsR/SmtB family transcription factor n=1 Tax=Desulfosporosinus sp. FKB TaxID=1969835 RepID=UPI001FA8BB0E|nr:metalloregulator ArsR/SmtB family transcription factor [Desulfosporosinus sp. FKB]